MNKELYRVPVDKEIQASLLSLYMIALTRVLNYITSFFLIFFLSSSDFGVIAIAMSVIAIMNSLSSFGIDSSLISYQGDEKYLLNDAWSLELLKGITLSILLILIAPLISTWFDQPILFHLLLVLSLVFILQSSKNVGLVSLRKSFDFKVIFKCEIGMAVTNLFLTITIAYYYRSPWAIVIGYVGGWLMYLLISYLLCSFRPRISFEPSNVKALLGYSKWILFSAQINTIIENGLNFFIGSYFGMSLLGQFERADMFTRKTVLQIGEVAWKVGLPSLSARGYDISAIKGHYILMFRFMCLIVFPVIVVVCKYLPTFINIRLENDWETFQSFLFVLGILAILTILLTPAAILFQAMRVPRIGFKIAFIRLLSISVSIVPLVYFYQQLGVAYALLLGVIVVLPISFYSVSKLIKISIIHHLTLPIPYLASCGVFYFFSPGSKPIIFDLINIALGFIFYLIILSLVSKQTRNSIKLCWGIFINKIF